MYNAFGEIWGAEGRMARINPLLYRGYFLCSSLGMYYLQSRYYDPWIGRFINADATWVLGVNQGSLLQFNLFTYCLNNPVNMIDPTGYVGFSTSGVQCWHLLNHSALMTGGSGNTTGWAGSPQQTAATQQVVQQLLRTANNQNSSSQQRIDAQAQVYVLQITILRIPIVLNWENPAQNLASQRIMSTHQGDWASVMFRSAMIFHGTLYMASGITSSPGDALVALGGGGLMFAPVPGARGLGAFIMGYGLIGLAENAYKINSGFKVINDALFRWDINIDSVLDVYLPWR